MEKINFTKLLYIFLLSNTFIAGFFNFLIPLYLYNQGFKFSSISLFAAIAGLTFFLFMFLLEYLINKLSISDLISITFLSYAVFLSSIFFMQSVKYFVIILGILSGIYLSLFWILQRLFFIETISKNNAGKKFGNIQIFVGISTQLAILLGSFLLEYSSFKVIYFISMTLLFLLISHTVLKRTSEKFESSKRNTILDILKFKSKDNLKIISIIDGFFLILEANFWILIIFLFAKGNFFEVGKIVTTLAVIFFIVYIFIKNRIDKTNIRKVYILSTILYSLSWILRSLFTFISNQTIEYLLIYLIGFLTLFFRLIFNKIFFENAKKSSKRKYILIKSYYSQFTIFIIYSLISFSFFITNESLKVFNWAFVLASILTFIYLTYKISPTSLQEQRITKLQ